MLRIALLFLLFVTSAHAEGKSDWNGQWQIVVPLGDPMSDILDVKNGKVQGLRVAGCIFVPVDTFKLSADELHAHFVVPGAEYTIVFIRSAENEAKAFHIDGPDLGEFDRRIETRNIALRHQVKSCNEN